MRSLYKRCSRTLESGWSTVFINILDHIENLEVQHLNLKFDEGSTIKFKGLKRKFLIDGIKLSGYKTTRIILDPDYFI